MSEPRQKRHGISPVTGLSAEASLDQCLLPISIHDMSRRVVFANQALKRGYKELTSREFPYGKCYKVLYGRTAPCESCPQLDSIHYQQWVSRSWLTSEKEERWVNRTVLKDESGDVKWVMEVAHPLSLEHNLYRFATELGSAKLPKVVGEILVKGLQQLGFSKTEIYVLQNSSVLGRLELGAMAEDQVFLAFDTTITEKQDPGGFVCLKRRTPVAILPSSLATASLIDVARRSGFWVHVAPEDRHSNTLLAGTSAFDFPMLATGDLIGKVRVFARDEPPQVLTETQVDAIGAFVSHCAETFRNIQLSRKMRLESLQLTTHEMNEPIQAIIAAAEDVGETVIPRATISKERRTYYGRIIENICYAAKTVSFLNAGVRYLLEEHPTLDIQGSDMLGTIVAPIVRMLRMTMHRNVTVDYSRKAFGEMPILYLDRAALMEILFNLLGNAIKYANEPSTVRMYAQATPKGWEIHFIDYGIPIPSGKEEWIFGIGHRTDEALKKNFVGTGRGLYISRRVARLHGGDVRVTSNHEPTVFTVILPRRLTRRDWHESNSSSRR